HLIDVAPLDGSDPVHNAELIEAEVAAYSDALAERPIWMVLSKIDLLPEDAVAELRGAIARAFPDRPVFAVSSATSAGIDELINALMVAVVDIRERLTSDAAFAEEQSALADRIGDDVLQSSLARRAATAARAEDSDNDNGDLGDGQVEVVHVPE
ncbi:MAG: hypothetical protein OES38_08775, partial [Gammaproteobacteria bacterium]|nr:hypothetical protein [Gammaproteobacteria bacterium]